MEIMIPVKELRFSDRALIQAALPVPDDNYHVGKWRGHYRVLWGSVRVATVKVEGGQVKFEIGNSISGDEFKRKLLEYYPGSEIENDCRWKVLFYWFGGWAMSNGDEYKTKEAAVAAVGGFERVNSACVFGYYAKDWGENSLKSFASFSILKNGELDTRDWGPQTLVLSLIENSKYRPQRLLVE